MGKRGLKTTKELLLFMEHGASCELDETFVLQEITLESWIFDGENVANSFLRFPANQYFTHGNEVANEGIFRNFKYTHKSHKVLKTDMERDKIRWVWWLFFSAVSSVVSPSCTTLFVASFLMNLMSSDVRNASLASIARFQVCLVVIFVDFGSNTLNHWCTENPSFGIFEAWSNGPSSCRIEGLSPPKKCKSWLFSRMGNPYK